MNNERLNELSTDRAFLVNLEAVHGVRLTEEGKELVEKKIEKIDKEWRELNERA